MYKPLFFSALLLFLVAAYLLISGHPILVYALSQSPAIPAGTPITWFGMIALPLIFYTGIQRIREPHTKIEQVFALLLKTCIALACLWVPIAYLLAGNLSFSFSEKTSFQGGQNAMRIFWGFTYTIVGAPLVWGLSYGIVSLLRKFRP